MRAWAEQTDLSDARRVIDQEWVQLNLARVHAKVEFLKLLNIAIGRDFPDTRSIAEMTLRRMPSARSGAGSGVPATVASGRLASVCSNPARCSRAP